MKRLLVCILTLMALCSLLCVTASAAETVEVQVTGVLDYSMAEEVFSQLNTYRASNGLNKLVLDANLTAAAMQRAVECSLAYGPNHLRPDGSKCNTAYPYSGTWAENLAIGQSSAGSVMNAWKNSSGHNSNMLNTKVTHVGIGCAYIDGQYHWVQVFMNKGADNTNDYSGKTHNRFLYTVDALKSGLTPRRNPTTVKVVIDPRTDEVTGNSFTLSYQYTHDDGSSRPVLIPTAFVLKNGTVEDVIIRDSDGKDFARLSLATDGSSDIIVTPLAENGTADVELPFSMPADL